jgi:hypothetical protein
MESNDYIQLETELKQALVDEPAGAIAIVGHTPLALHLISLLSKYNALERLSGIYSPPPVAEHTGGREIKPMPALAEDRPTIVTIAADEDKERLLEDAAPHLPINARVLLAGHGHFQFRDAIFQRVTSGTLVQSLANGYPNSLIHLFQCLQNAARLALKGVVVEFGMFRGGTTMTLSRFVEELGQDWRVIGFDTFAGFPPRRSVLDMYSHPDCVFRDEASVRRYLAGRNVEVVPGDIVTTAGRLKGEAVVLAFIDTDNYTSASAALDAVQDGVVTGGAIVLDHFTGRDRHKYTLGERIAAKRLLTDPRYFHLHDTGVFMRQR